jgi:hypothetical protein
MNPWPTVGVAARAPLLEETGVRVSSPPATPFALTPLPVRGAHPFVLVACGAACPPLPVSAPPFPPEASGACVLRRGPTLVAQLISHHILASAPRSVDPSGKAPVEPSGPPLLRDTGPFHISLVSALAPAPAGAAAAGATAAPGGRPGHAGEPATLALLLKAVSAEVCSPGWTAALAAGPRSCCWEGRPVQPPVDGPVVLVRPAPRPARCACHRCAEWAATVAVVGMLAGAAVVTSQRFPLPFFVAQVRCAACMGVWYFSAPLV